jgi:hypothetical protein
VIRLTWPGLALGLAVVLLWSFGDIVFADWLGVNPLSPTGAVAPIRSR